MHLYKLYPIFFIPLMLGVIACNKNQNFKNNPIDSATIFGVKDSTLLIRSISIIAYDSSTGAITDSATKYYFYDTVKNAIVLSIQPISKDSDPYDGYELNYNSQGLLSHIGTKYSFSTPDGSSISSTDYTYDASQIISTTSVKFIDNSQYAITFNKTSLPSGGYQLNWRDPSSNNGPPDSVLFTVNFDNKGQFLEYYYTSGSQTQHKDSTIYDLSGNVNKVIQTDYFYLTPPYLVPDSSFSYTWYEFVTRDTKGDALYNLDRIINNGMPAVPNSLTSTFTGLTEVDEYAYQYTKYPALSAIIRRQNATDNSIYYSNYNSLPQYDSKNRLTKYRLFFNDTQLSYVDYMISYYK